ncbi:MAG: T9SS type A sorting domain-containing protein, partial [Bacteroidia bacterium]
SQVTAGDNHVVGGISDITVTYNFGNVQSLETFNLQPCGNVDFNAGAFQLVNTEVLQSEIAGINVGDRDKLFHIASSFAGGTNKVVQIRYYFLNKVANATTLAVPYAVQTSGGANPNNPSSNKKYNPDYGQYTATLTTTTSPFTITKTADQFLVNNQAYVNYDVEIHNNSDQLASVSSITVDLPTDMQLVAINGGSGVNTNTSMMEPATGTQDMLQWYGNQHSSVFPYTDYLVQPNQSIHLLYQAQTTTDGVNLIQESNAQAFYGASSTNIAYADICVTCSNHDNDNLVDILDMDDDNDGIQDVIEMAGLGSTQFINGIDPLADDDKDGTMNYLDTDSMGFVDVNGDGVNDRYDADGDGIINMLDLDADNDGIQDIVEARAVDANFDGMADAIYLDANQNGIAETYEGANTLATHLLDLDQDGIINSLDLDADNDGILDLVELQQTDVNHDGRIDNSTDLNTNGWADAVEGQASIVRTGADINNDGRADSYISGDTDSDVVANFLDIDADADGIVDLIESQASGSNPLSPYLGLILPLGVDLNQNGIDDAFEGTNYISPLNSDGSGTQSGNLFGADETPDFLDNNTDNDSWSDLAEGNDANLDLMIDTFPVNQDTDQDGLDNSFDGFALMPNGANARVNNILGGTAPVQSSTILPSRDFRSVNNMGPLPVALLSFTGKTVGDAVQLDWKTATEINSDYFVVERSVNGHDFEGLSSVDAIGGIGVQTNYHFLDVQKITEDVINLRYRLKIVDNDGQFSHSNTIEVKINKYLQPTQIKAEPNPAKDGVLHLNYFLAENGDATISIRNTIGQEVMRKTVNGNMLWQSSDIDVANWASGVYFVNLNDGLTSKVLQVVVE